MADDTEQSGLDLGGGDAGAGYVVLARKYRPETFDDLIGQDAMVTTLRNAFASDRIAQGYMLTGVRGVGKTTTARILARALNFEPVEDGQPEGPTVNLKGYGAHCKPIIQSNHPDVMEMDAASNTGVDNIREIIESARYRPLNARYKVFIIDEVHMLSKGAFNALLKTLEEPPPHVKFIFATTEIRKVPVTVLSRCQRFDLRRVDVSVLVAHFKKIAEAEGATADDDALALIARAAEGSVRDGLSILDQAIAMGQGAVTADGVRAMIGLADRGRIFDLLEALLGGQAADALSLFDGLHRDGGDPLQMMGDLADTVHAITRAKVSGADAAGDGLSAAERARAGDFAERLNMAVLARAWQLLARGLEDVARAPDAKAGADMVLVRLAYTADLPTPGELIKAMGGEAAVMTGHGAASSGGGNGATARGGTPPMRAIAGGGRSAPAPQPAAREAAPDTRPANAAAPARAGPQSFFDVIALASQKRDAKLKMHLEDHVRLVAFDQGRIEISTLPEAPANLANTLGEKLSKWTGQRWIVSVSSEDGAEPVGDGLRREAAARLADVSQHPAVRAVLDGLPGVEITGITPLATGAAESAETAPADGGPVDGVAGGDDVEPDDE